MKNLFTCFILLLAHAVFADTITLTDNRIIYGHVTFDGATLQVTYRDQNDPNNKITKTIPRSALVDIVFDDREVNNRPIKGLGFALEAYIPGEVRGHSASLAFLTDGPADADLVVKYGKDESPADHVASIADLSSLSSEKPLKRAQLENLQPGTNYRWEALGHDGKVLDKGGFKTQPSDSNPVPESQMSRAWIRDLDSTQAVIQCDRNASVQYGVDPDTLDKSAPCSTIDGGKSAILRNLNPSTKYYFLFAPANNQEQPPHNKAFFRTTPGPERLILRDGPKVGTLKRITETEIEWETHGARMKSGRGSVKEIIFPQ